MPQIAVLPLFKLPNTSPAGATEKIEKLPPLGMDMGVAPALLMKWPAATNWML